MRFPVPVLLLVVSCLGAQSPTPSPAPEGPSFIALPVRINLDPILQGAERATPRVPPGVETWIPLPAVKGGAAVYRYNLYRDALAFHASGNRVQVRTTAHYWMEVGLKVGGIVKGVGSCGLGREGYRQVYLGVQAELGLTPAWGLNLRATPLDPMALSPCVITFLGYDITDKVLAGMKDALLKGTQAMEQQVRDSAALRQRAESAWAQAQQPVEVSPGVFLMLNPEAVRLGAMESQGNYLVLTPEFQARPALVLGSKPAVAPRPLPPLETLSAPAAPGFRLHVGADLSFVEATAQLRSQMAGKRFDTNKGSFQVLDVAMRGLGDRIALDLQIKGRVDGRLTLVGRPVYDAQEGRLKIVDLEYSLETQSWITKFGEWLYRSTLKKTLAEKANWFMDKSLGDLRAKIQTALNRPLGSGLSLSGHLDTLKLDQPQLLADHFHVDAHLEGQLQVEFSGAVR